MRSLALLTTMLALVAGQGRTADFRDWAAVVVSGDDHAAHARTRTEAFDNARRDVVTLLERRGFQPDHIAQFSVEAGREHVALSQPGAILHSLAELAKTAPGGCLVYLSSHGAPRDIVVGQADLTPGQLARGLRAACGDRPTAVVLSACFSGSFLPALEGPNRFVLTAARRDRSSFGCGESDRYPYFDGCVIEALPTTADLVALADRARACVRQREDEENLRPRSEPQLFVGPEFAREDPAFTP